MFSHLTPRFNQSTLGTPLRDPAVDLNHIVFLQPTLTYTRVHDAVSPPLGKYREDQASFGPGWSKFNSR